MFFGLFLRARVNISWMPTTPRAGRLRERYRAAGTMYRGRGGARVYHRGSNPSGADDEPTGRLVGAVGRGRGGARRRVALRVQELEEQLRLEEAQVRVALHHVLDAPLGPVERVRVRVVRLHVRQRDEPRLRVEVHLFATTSTRSVTLFVSERDCRLRPTSFGAWTATKSL